MVSAKAFEREKGGHGEPYIKIWWWKLGMNPAEYRSIVYRIVWLAISGNRDRLGDPPSNPKCIFAA